MAVSKKQVSMQSVFMNGILSENPIFRLVLGMCPTLAVSTSAMNGIGMGAAVIFVLTGSNLVISLLRQVIPGKVRIPIFIVVICTFVTLVQMVMKAFFPALDAALGIFIPLIVVNCIVLARAEAFASKYGPLLSVIDGVAMGIGFTISLTAIGIVRELIGSGTIFGVNLLGASYEPMLLMILAPGGFITLGLAMAVVNSAANRPKKREQPKASEVAASVQAEEGGSAA